MALTQTVDTLLADVLDAFKVQFPMFNQFSKNYSAEGKVLGDTLKARIRKSATVQDYDATNGYQANAATSTDLLEDIPVTLNRHKHVPVKIDHIDSISSQIDLNEATAQIAFDLGEEALLYAMGLVRQTNFSQQSPYATADSDLDALINIQGDLNTIGASGSGRFGIVNTAVAAAIAGDSRVTDADFYGQQSGVAMPFRTVTGVAGFQNIWEYPSLPSNTTASIDVTAAAATELLTAASAHSLLVGDRVVFTTTTTLPAGLSLATDYYVITVPSTTTFTVSATDGGSVVDITDTGTGTHSFTRETRLTGFFGAPEAISLVAAVPNKFINPSDAMTKVSDIVVQQDSDTGLSLAALHWVEAKTMDEYVTLTWLYGATAGRQAGSAGDITDYAGHLLVTA